jgi:AmmeMemoRadiSam system protein B
MLSISHTESWFNIPSLPLKKGMTKPLPITLSDYITDLMNKNKIKSTDKRKAFVVPHAGIAFSGQVSAIMYNHLLMNINNSKSKRINLVVLAANHHIQSNSLILPSFTSVELTTRTPFLVNVEMIQELYKVGTNISFDNPSTNDFFKNEHSFFNQLPFLDYVRNQIKKDIQGQKEVKLIPIIIGTTKVTPQLEQALLQIINKPSTFVIISSDFNHLGPRFGSLLPSMIGFKKRDLDAIELLLQQNEKAEKELSSNNFSVCGYKALLLYFRLKNIKKTNLNILIRKTSFDSEKENKENKENSKSWKDQDGIVSYLGILIK